MLQAIQSDKPRIVRNDSIFLGQQRNPNGPHLARIRRKGDIASHIFLEGAQHSGVPECTALHHNMLSKRIYIVDTNHLGKHILHNRAAEARHNVVFGLAVALFRDDGAVHEHRATAA